MTTITRFTPAFGRLLLAALFVISGVGKLADPAGTIAYIQYAHLPLPQISYGVALAVELLGGVLLIVGYRTRLVALVLALFTVAAAIGFHNNFGDQNQMIHFLKNIAITGGLLQVFAFGAGSFSLDAKLGKN